MKNYNHTIKVMKKHDYPQEAVEVITRAEEKILANEEANKIYDSMYKAYWIKKQNFDRFSDKTKKLAELIDEHIYTVNLVLLLNCTKPLLALYKKKGISEEIYWDTVLDLKSKMLESKENYNVWGTFVEGWFRGFYNLDRFALGRLQFENSGFCCEYYEKHGVKLFDDDYVLGMHIPSHQGPITYEARLDSYRKAYNFFKDKFGRYGLFCCHSWLLYPDNLNIMPEKSNMADFVLDFDLLEVTWNYDFGNSWRVFGVDYKNKPASELPRNNTQQRCFAEWLEKGKKTGTAYGIVVYDSETDTILTRHNRGDYDGFCIPGIE